MTQEDKRKALKQAMEAYLCKQTQLAAKRQDYLLVSIWQNLYFDFLEELLDFHLDKYIEEYGIYDVDLDENAPDDEKNFVEVFDEMVDQAILDVDFNKSFVKSLKEQDLFDDRMANLTETELWKRMDA